MEFKDLERTNFNWFGIKEIKDYNNFDANQINFLTKYSFAPFVPYWAYSLIRSNWDFILLRFAASFLFGIAYMIIYFVYIFGFIFKDLMSLSKLGFSDSSESFTDISSGNMEPFSMMSGIFTKLIIALIVYLFLDLAVNFAEGLFSRRLSWNRLSWKDFQSYKYSEEQWNIAGLVFFIIRLFGLILCIVLLIVFWKYFFTFLK